LTETPSDPDRKTPLKKSDVGLVDSARKSASAPNAAAVKKVAESSADRRDDSGPAQAWRNPITEEAGLRFEAIQNVPCPHVRSR